MRRKSFQADSFRWQSPSHAWYLHGVVFLSLIINGGIAGVAILVNKVEIPLPEFTIFSGRNSVTLRALLPAAASALGFIANFISMTAFKALVDTYAKKKGLEGGLTLKRIADLSKFGGGGLVLGFSRYLILGAAILAIAAGTPSSLTASLTPTPYFFGAESLAPIAGFGTFAGGVNNLTCYYPDEGGYGEGCAVNDRYGVMFDAALLELTQDGTKRYTRNGTSYPIELSGITGEISQLSTRLVRLSTNGAVEQATSNTTIKACVPQTIVKVECQPNRAFGVSWENLGQADTAATNKDMSITQARFCPTSGCNTDNDKIRTAPDYGRGSTFIFEERIYETGHTIVMIAATGTYATALGTDTLTCDVSAFEVLVAIEIKGQSLEKSEDQSFCQSIDLPQVRTDKMTDITFMAQMGIQKMQGQDGRLEILRLAKDNGLGKGMALQPAIQRMVSVGATEMYTRLSPADSLLMVPYTIKTTRTRLATSERLGLLWFIPPALFFIIILSGWIFLGFSYAASVYWSPMDPVAMVVAGAAAKPGGALYLAMRNWAGADPNDILKAVPGRIRLAEVIPGHLGMALGDVESAPAPMRGQHYGGSMITRNSMMSPQLGSTPLSPYKDQYSPDPAQPVMPTLPGNGYFPSMPQQPEPQMQQAPNQRWSAQGPY